MVHQGPCPVPAGEGVCLSSRRNGPSEPATAAAPRLRLTLQHLPPHCITMMPLKVRVWPPWAKAVGCTLRYGALITALEDTGHDARPRTQRPRLGAWCVPPVCIGPPLYKNPLGVSPQVSHPHVSPSPHTRRTPTPSTHLHTHVPTRPLVQAAACISVCSTSLSTGRPHAHPRHPTPPCRPSP